MTAAPRQVAWGFVARCLAAVMLLGATVIGFVETKANGVNCGSAIIPSTLQGGALLTGDISEDDATLGIIRADCGRLVTRQRFTAGVLAAAGAGMLWWSRRFPVGRRPPSRR